MADTNLKRKRGRPRAFGWLEDSPDREAAEYLAIVKRGKPSRRTLQHRLYHMEALAALRGEDNQPDPRYAWIEPRHGVIAEIGRVAVAVSRDEARNFADWLLEQVEDGCITTTREAELWLRAQRRDFLAWRKGNEQ